MSPRLKARIAGVVYLICGMVIAGLAYQTFLSLPLAAALMSTAYCEGTMSACASTSSRAGIGGAKKRTACRRSCLSSATVSRGTGGVAVGSTLSR